MYHKLDGLEFHERISEEVPADDSASMGEKMLLYWLLRELKPEVVVETGTHRGLTSLYMAHALYDNKKGSLHTADPFEWGQTGNFAKFPEFFPYLKFYQKEGSEMIAELDKVDFAFIDGFHEAKDVIPEIKKLYPKLSANAVVVFHDCWYQEDKTGVDGVNEALEESGLVTTWLPTTNALRIYQLQVGKPKGRQDLYGERHNA